MRPNPGRPVRPTLAILLGLLLAVPASAQRQETLLSDGFESGGFGGPMVQVLAINDEPAVFVGGRGGWIINHAFSIGGGGWGLVTDVATSVTDTATTDTRLMVGYGGLVIEYMVRPHELIHYGASLLTGWGTAAYLREGTGPDPDSPFFVLEPAVHAELNVTEYFRIALGASWRHTQGIDLDGFTDEDMEQLAGVLTFKFGSF